MTTRKRSPATAIIPSSSTVSRVEDYTALGSRLDQLRDSVRRDRTDDTRTLVEVRGDHAGLCRSLEEAMSQALVAAGAGSPCPVGISSWMAEGLARSEERELALIAAEDIGGMLPIMTAPNLVWGGPAS